MSEGVAASHGMMRSPVRPHVERRRGMLLPLEDVAEEEEQPEETGPELAAKRRTAAGPSKLERERHEGTHIPYREWCESCVAGRGRAGRHAASGRTPVNRLRFEYFFSDDDAKMHPVLVCHDEATGNQLARIMEHTGLTGNDDVIADIVDELKSWGYGHDGGAPLAFVSSGEPASQAFRDRLMQLLPGRNVAEEAVLDQPAHGARAEGIGRPVRELVRTLLDVIRRRSGVNIGTGDGIPTWVWRWAAMLRNRCVVGSDGKTPYARLRNRPCRMETMPFGERVSYLVRDPSRDKTEGRFSTGIWLGHARVSNEHWIGTAEGVTQRCGGRPPRTPGMARR